MPFAYNGRLVSGLLKHFGKGGLGTVERSGVFIEQVAVHVGMAARVNAGAGWSAKGVGAVAAVEYHAFVRQLAEIRVGHGRIFFTGAQGLVGMIVRDNDQNIWPLVLLLGLGAECQGGGAGRQQQAVR